MKTQGGEEGKVMEDTRTRRPEAKKCKGANAAGPRAKVQKWITKTKIRVAGGGLRWRVAGERWQPRVNRSPDNWLGLLLMTEANITVSGLPFEC